MSTPTYNPALATMARGEGVEIGGVEHLEALEQVVANAVGHGHMAGMYRPAAEALVDLFFPPAAAEPEEDATPEPKRGARRK